MAYGQDLEEYKRIVDEAHHSPASSNRVIVYYDYIVEEAVYYHGRLRGAVLDTRYLVELNGLSCPVGMVYAGFFAIPSCIDINRDQKWLAGTLEALIEDSQSKPFCQPYIKHLVPIGFLLRVLLHEPERENSHTQRVRKSIASLLRRLTATPKRIGNKHLTKFWRGECMLVLLIGMVLNWYYLGWNDERYLRQLSSVPYEHWSAAYRALEAESADSPWCLTIPREQTSMIQNALTPQPPAANALQGGVLDLFDECLKDWSTANRKHGLVPESVIFGGAQKENLSSEQEQRAKSQVERGRKR